MPRKHGTRAAKINKSVFVRSQPASMTARDVVAKAKSRGISIKENYVYTVRALAKRRTSKRGPGRPRKNAVAATQNSAAATGVEQLLRAAAAEIGLSRALEILRQQRDAVRAVLGG